MNIKGIEMNKNKITEKTKKDDAFDLLSIKIQKISSKLIGYILPAKIIKGLQEKSPPND